MTKRKVFRLEVEKLGTVCSFKLYWGIDQKRRAELDYRASLSDHYEAWQNAYLHYYSNLLRGRAEKFENIQFPPEYWHTKLVNAEAKLRAEFHQWLRGFELHEIQTIIARATRESSEQGHDGVDVFVTCYSSELRRLPWEAWEIGGESLVSGTIRIFRSTTDIQQETVKPRRGRTRILVIVGYDKDLGLDKDLQTVYRNLNRIANLEFIDCRSVQNFVELKEQIRKALADERGWDALFFSGHSSETSLTGGELGLAPGVFLAIQEIKEALIQAKKQGLQFAMFNSCNGLSIAESLIRIGLSQVAVMREPIHDEVAQEFLVRFLQVLAEYKDVREALLAACQHLNLKKEITYPSSYLIPSLFCHPSAVSFRIKPCGIKWWLQQWLPKPKEAIVALGGILLLSAMSPVQGELLDLRMGIQAIYRDKTGQLPQPVSEPIALIAIDPESLQEENIDAYKINPMDRTYLAKLVKQLLKLEARVIGIDYLFDAPQIRDDRVLKKSVSEAVDKQGAWFVFASKEPEGKHRSKVPLSIASNKWSLQGNLSIPLYLYSGSPTWEFVLPASAKCSDNCPFAYQLALVQTLKQAKFLVDLPQPNLKNLDDLQNQVIDFLERNKNNNFVPLTQADITLGMQPIIDLSIPPNHVYQYITARKIFDDDLPVKKLGNQVIIISPGGYDQADDNFPVPLAIRYWRSTIDSKDINIQRTFFTGGEIHAYMIHHLLSKHHVVLVPPFFLICIAALLGKGINLILEGQKWKQRKKWSVGLIGFVAVYGLATLQLYIWFNVLIPWLLPSMTFLVFVPSFFRIKTNA